MHIKDISQAFIYHLKWKSRLKDFVEGRGDFDIDEISTEGCELGKWLSSGEMKQYAPDSVIEELMAAHDGLHVKAKRVYDFKVKGHNLAAHQELGDISKFSMKIYSLLTSVNIISENEKFSL